MAVRKLLNGKYEIRYPSHRNSKGKKLYRTQVVGYSKRKAKEHELKKFSDFMEREFWGISHEPEKQREYSVSGLLDWYLDLDEVKGLKSYRDTVGRTRPLKEYFGDRKANELEKADVREYRKWRKGQKAKRNKSICSTCVANATVNREIARLRRCYNLAMQEKILKENPCWGLKDLEEKERDRICSFEEFEALRSELHTEARDILTVACYTGMRISEITGLDWSRVDLKNGLIHLRKEDTKTKTSRLVPFLHQDVWGVFERLGGNPRRICGRVFGIKSIRSPFETACRKLGIKDLRIHDFRHTAATNMRKSGHATSVVMKICGWKSVQMFMRYDKVADEDILQANVVGIAYVEGKSSDIPLTGKTLTASNT
jgi:integrase